MASGIAMVRHPLSQFSYASLPADVEMWLLCHEGKSQIGRTTGGVDPARVTAYPNYETNDLVEYDAARIIESSDCRGIITLSEVDMLRAAGLRTRYDLPGLKLETARRFRDKVLMKTRLREAGFRVPRFLPVESGLDAMAAAEEFGYPFVVKPRLGGGSIGARVVRDEAALRELLGTGLRSTFYTPAHLEAEEFVRGDLHHVDGLVLDGAVRLHTVSKYRSDLLEFSTVVSTRMVDQRSTTAHRLTGYTFSVLDELGLLRPGTHSYFHCEVFTAPGGPVLCEVAARPGGLGIVDQVDTYHGVRTFELLLAATFGQSDGAAAPDGAAVPGGRRDLVGWVGVPKHCDPATVREAIPQANRVGERMHRTSVAGRQMSSVDLDGFVLVRGGCESELDALLGDAVARLAKEAA